jgi:hypothetical protein
MSRVTCSGCYGSGERVKEKDRYERDVGAIGAKFLNFLTGVRNVRERRRSLRKLVKRLSSRRA